MKLEISENELFKENVINLFFYNLIGVKYQKVICNLVGFLFVNRTNLKDILCKLPYNICCSFII